MPFLELVWNLIIFGVVVAILIAGAFAYVMFGAVVFVAVVATGWIPILMCASDPNYAIGFEYGFVGGWAALATMAYIASSLGVVVLSFVRPDPDGLPPGWKFLSLFNTYTPAATAKSSIGTENRSWDMEKFADSLEEGAPTWGYNKATSGFQMFGQATRARKEAELLKRENDKREKEMKAAADLAEAMMDLEREKARKEAYDGS